MEGSVAALVADLSLTPHVPECGAVITDFREACQARPPLPFPQKETEQCELQLPTPSMDPMSLHNPLNENYILLQFIISSPPFVAAGGGAECSGKICQQCWACWALEGRQSFSVDTATATVAGGAPGYLEHLSTGSVPPTCTAGGPSRAITGGGN